MMPAGAAGVSTHIRNLNISSFLSRYRLKNAITPERVIDVLNAAEAQFMLVGAHASGNWSNQPRNTQDVDILAATRSVRSAIQALRTAFPQLVFEDTRIVGRFADPQTKMVLIDVMKPNQPLFKVAMRYTYRVESRKRSYFLPSLEFMLAMKFAAMVSPRRRIEKKYFDVGDFASIVAANPEIDLAKTALLGERVYAGGGAEIVEMIRQVRAGEKLTL